jgi:hypothetical protein
MAMVDDDFWLQYAVNSIQNSITSINDGAAKLEKMTLWFWGLYTASYTIGVSINLIDAAWWVLVLLASPVVLLIFTYWFCVLAQLPVYGGHANKNWFDPRIPFEIKQGYNAALKNKNFKFRIALVFTFLSALLLGVALFSLSFVHKKDRYLISAVLNDKKDKIIISGTLPKNIIVKTNIDSLNKLKNKITFYTNLYKIQENGILNLNVPVNPMPKEIIVTATWREGNVEKGFVQTLNK